MLSIRKMTPFFFNSFTEFETDNEIDIDFNYEDSDIYDNEIAELYCYTEIVDFHKNFKAFHVHVQLNENKPDWVDLPETAKEFTIQEFLNQLESTSEDTRMLAARSLLYIAQGCWGQVQTREDLKKVTISNVLLLYKLGTFTAVIDLLNLEINKATNIDLQDRFTPKNPSNLRCILSLIYIILETVRFQYEKDDKQFIDIAIDLMQELTTPLPDGELLIMKLFGMLNLYVSSNNIHFPLKKICLLLWKIMLFGHGGMKVLRTMKDERRQKMNLPPIPEDTLEVSKTLKSAAPPPNSAEILRNSLKKPRKNKLCCRKVLGIQQQQSQHLQPQRSLLPQQQYQQQHLQIQQHLLQIPQDKNLNSLPKRLTISTDKFRNKQHQVIQDMLSDDVENLSGEDDAATLKADEDSDSQSDTSSETFLQLSSSSLTDELDLTSSANLGPRIPWTLKAREKDILKFIVASRKKFIAINLPPNSTCTAGLPIPIQESIEVLKKYQYTSLADLQIKHMNQLEKYPLTTPPEEIPNTGIEMLYEQLLPNMTQHLCTILKIMLAASPSIRNKVEGINLSLEVTNMQMPFNKEHSTKLEIDIARHKEIIAKALSAFLILLLKHLKLNHIYQFEYAAQVIMFSNVVPIFSKYFNHSVVDQVEFRNNLPMFEFPLNVIEDSGGHFINERSHSPVLNDRCYSWRNLFTYINILRVLNKLVKWKQARVMMLVIFKWNPLLKKALKVRHPTFHLYLLKLLKMQIKFTGRQWRKTNMHTIGAIYSKVRHRLNEDWVHGSDLEARPWDFQADESNLKDAIDRLHSRRYPTQYRNIFMDNVSCGLSAFNSDNSLNESGTNFTTTLIERHKSINNAIRLCSFMYEDIINKHNKKVMEEKDKIIQETKQDHSQDEELSESFKNNYETWLEHNVYLNVVDWDTM